MEVYLSNNNMEPDVLIDGYESLIWTDRYQDAGDFKLVIRESARFTEDLRNYKYLLASFSNRIMMIETVDDNDQNEGPNKLVITGQSIEAFLKLRDNRTFRTTDPISLENKAPADHVQYYVNRYCINPPDPLNNVNIVPGLVMGDIYAPPPAVNLTIERATIYDIIRSIIVPFGLGFSIDRNIPGKLRFSCYKGKDRSIVGDPGYMEYSPNNDNLLAPHRLESIANYKNHCRVLGAKAGADAYLPGVNGATLSGFQRRTMVLEARDIGADDTTTVAQDIEALEIRGRAELFKLANNYSRLIDGTVPQSQWPRDSGELGDIVVVKDTTGASVRMRISEQIWTSDTANGKTKIPTFEEIDKE